MSGGWKLREQDDRHGRVQLLEKQDNKKNTEAGRLKMILNPSSGSIKRQVFGSIYWLFDFHQVQLQTKFLLL